MADTKISALTDYNTNTDDSLMYVASDGFDTYRIDSHDLQRFQTLTFTATISRATDSARMAIVLNQASSDIAVTLTGLEGGEELQIFAQATYGAGSGHTVILGGGLTWDGTNTTANFNADGESMIAFIQSGRAFVIYNNGVTFSA